MPFSFVMSIFVCSTILYWKLHSVKYPWMAIESKALEFAILVHFEYCGVAHRILLLFLPLPITPFSLFSFAPYLSSLIRLFSSEEAHRCHCSSQEHAPWQTLHNARSKHFLSTYFFFRNVILYDLRRSEQGWCYISIHLLFFHYYCYFVFVFCHTFFSLHWATSKKMCWCWTANQQHKPNARNTL